MPRWSSAALRCTALVLAISAIELAASKGLGRFRGTLAAEASLALVIAALICRTRPRRLPGAMIGASLAVLLAMLVLHATDNALPRAWLLGVAIAAGIEELIFREMLPRRLATDAPAAAVVLAQLTFALAHLAAAWPQLAPARFLQLFVAGLCLYGVVRLTGLWAAAFLHVTLNIQALGALDAPGWYAWRVTAALTVALALVAAYRKRPDLRCIFSPRCPANPASTHSASAAPSPAGPWTSRPS